MVVVVGVGAVAVAVAGVVGVWPTTLSWPPPLGVPAT
jgi:hypothetical protein